MTTLSLIINQVLNLNNNIFFKDYKSDNIDLSENSHPTLLPPRQHTNG
jgi:hypothetical protein